MNAAPAFAAELMRWALAYAERGIPVLPAFGKRPAPGLRWQNATRDPDLVRGYWSTWPLAQIATLTGEASGLVVLDIDRKGGVDGFETLRARGWTIPANAVEVITPSGGSHFYFAFEEGIATSAGKLGPGVDVRGRAGLVILPPSRSSVDGADYAFAEGQERREPGVLL